MTAKHLSLFLPFVALFVLLLASGCRSSAIIRDQPSSSARSDVGSFETAAASSDSRNSEPKNSVIKRGDQIDVTVWGYTEFNTKATITEEGIITMPLVGDIKAEGLTKDQLVNELRKSLTEYVQGEPKITVIVTRPSNQRIAVLGSVTRQDNYPVTADVSILEIISTAGGTTPEADLQYVKILRGGKGEDPIVINVARSIDEGQTESLPKVRPGDTVFVPKKENFVREFADFLRDAVLVFGFFRVLY